MFVRNARALKPMIVLLAPWGKKTTYEKKRKDKGKERETKRERPFALTEGYFLSHCYRKSEKKQFFIRSPRGGTR